MALVRCSSCGVLNNVPLRGGRLAKCGRCGALLHAAVSATVIQSADAPRIKRKSKRGAVTAVTVGALAAVVCFAFLLVQRPVPQNAPDTTPSPHITMMKPRAPAEHQPTRCQTPPSNAQVLVRQHSKADGHTLTIENGSDADAIVKVKSAGSGKTVLSLFVKRGTNATGRDIPDGRYEIQFGFGGDLDGECRNFIQPLRTAAFPEIEDLTTQYGLGEYIVSRLTFTLMPVPDGNVQPQRIGTADFAQD
jgi:hypothetical protein